MTETKKINLIWLNVFIIGIFLVVIIKSYSGIVWDDYYWHYKIGEYIIQNHSIPTTGIFSWYANDMTWYYHEWLGGVLLYLTSFNTPNIMLIIINILFIFVISFTARHYIKHNWMAYNIFMLLAIAIISMVGFNNPRPYIYTYFLLFFELYILYKYKKNISTRLIYLLPILAVIWANIHAGSSILVYLLPIFFIITSFRTLTLGKLQFYSLSKKGTIKLSIITLISAGCICINPYGYKMLLYPYNNVVDDSIMLIQEWIAPDFKEVTTLFIASLLIITIILMMISKNNLDATDLLLIAFFTYIYIRSVRFSSYTVIISIFVCFKYVNKSEFNPNSKILFITSISSSIVLLISSIYILLNSDINKHLNSLGEDTCITEDAINIIKENNPSHLYNHYNLGGQLIYNNINVWIDGRTDLYSGQYSGDNLKDFYIMVQAKINENGEWEIENIINSYQFDMFICAKTDRTQLYLKNHPEKYRHIYSTDYIDIYKTY